MFEFLKNKIYVILGIFGLAILFLVLFFVWPLLSGIKSNSEDLLLQKNEAAILIVQSDQIEKFKKAYNEYRPNLEKFDKLFVDPKSPVDFIKFLEQTASVSSIKVEISLVPVDQQKDKNMIAFQLLSTDNFLDVVNFTQKLESGPYLIDIKSLSLKNADEDTTAKSHPSGKVDASFLINAFTK